MWGDDTLMGILLIALVLGSLITIGTIAARRRMHAEEDTPARGPAPEVRRRTPIRSRTLHQEAPAPDRLTAAIAQLVRTVRTPGPEVPARAGAVQGDPRKVPEVPISFDPSLPQNARELQALWQIGLHMQRGRSKADAIKMVTGVSKGGNQRYQRWSQMVDLAKEQPLYREYTPEMLAVLQPANGQDDD